jgi:hypothetical protein
MLTPQENTSLTLYHVVYDQHVKEKDRLEPPENLNHSEV